MATTQTANLAARDRDGLALIGRTLHDLRGIRFNGEEGGNTPPVPPAGQPATPPAPAAPAAPPAGEAPTAPTAWDGKVESLDPAVQKIIADLRKEAGDNRVAKNAETERVQAILAAAGIKTDDADDADPVEAAKKAAAERDAAQAQAQQTARELAIHKAAAAAGANPAALLDSNSFMSSVQGLDPTDGAAVAAAITAAVTANPNLKAARAAGVSGTDFSGSGEQGQVTEEQLARMSAEQIVEAQQKGLLNHLL